MIKLYKKLLILMILQKNIKEHNRNKPPVPSHSYKILTNTLLNLINHQLDIEKIRLYATDPY